MRNDPIIEDVRVATYRVPTDSPEADGTLEWDATELVVVHIRAGGQVGLGYSYTAAKPASALISAKLMPCLHGQSAFDLPNLWADLNGSLRNAGRPGLGMMAISAVDTALWDLKAKLLGISLTSLWGSASPSVPVYGSGGFTSYSDGQLQQQLHDWTGQGLSAVKIKIGISIEEDVRRIDLARASVGHGVELMVDANGAYDARSALALIDQIKGLDIRWFEEPVTSDNLDGLRWLRDRAPSGMAIAAGEYGWDGVYFQRMVAAGAVDVLQADVTRCGYTGFLQAAALCATFDVPLSAHCAPALHAPLCACIPGFRHLEYFHDHVRIESMLFTGQASLREGQLWPDLGRPGHGLELLEKEAEKYRL